MEQSGDKTKITMSSIVKLERHIHPSLKDIFAILLGDLLLVSIILLSRMFPAISPYLSPLRIPLSMFYIFFVPGFLLQALIFPRRADLDNLERVGISLGLSLAVVSMLAFVIDRSPWAIGIVSISVGQVGLILFLSAMVMIRKLSISKNMENGLTLVPSISSTWIASRFKLRWIGFLIAGLLVSAVMIGANFLEYSNSTHMTEFYILGSDGLAENYPGNVEVGEKLYFTVGINNLENDPAAYSIVIKSKDQQLANYEHLSLLEGETWQGRLEFEMPQPGDDQPVDILLARENYPFPYRALRIWLNVRSE